MVVINKIDSADPAGVATVRANIAAVNPAATVVSANSALRLDDPALVAGKRVLVVEDGPTLTHGGMKIGAGTVAAQRFGAAALVDPRPYLVGRLRETFATYPGIGTLLPAMGYGPEQLADLEATIAATPADTVVIGTPIDLARVIRIDKPRTRVYYDLEEIGTPDLAGIVGEFLARRRNGLVAPTGGPMPHPLDYPAAVRRDGLALAEAAAAAGPTAPVAGCPDWDVAELVWHITEVHYFWGEIVGRSLQDPEKVPPLERPADFPSLLALFRAGVERLASILAAADPTTPVWTWARQKDAGFVIRHQAQETAVHRADAERAAGREFTIDPALAADAIDEFFDLTAAFRRKGAAPVGGSVHMHPTDASGEWTISEDAAGALVLQRAHSKGDAAMRGPASDLLLILYRRIGTEGVETFGDAGVLERFLARTNLS